MNFQPLLFKLLLCSLTLFFPLSPLHAGGAVLKGRLMLADGQAVTNGRVGIADASAAAPTMTTVAATGGVFRIELKQELYNVTFSHPGYEPITVNFVDFAREPDAEIEVTLQRTNAPTKDSKQLLVLREKDSFDPAKGWPMVLENGHYSVNIPTDQPSETILFMAGDRMLNGLIQPFADDLTRQGLFATKLMSENGMIRVQFDQSILSFHSGKRREKMVAKGQRVLIVDQYWIRKMSTQYADVLAQKIQDGSTDEAGLEEFYRAARARKKQYGPTMALNFSGLVTSMFGNFSPEFHRTEDVLALIGQDPSIMKDLAAGWVMVPLAQNLWNTDPARSIDLLEQFVAMDVPIADKVLATYMLANLNRNLGNVEVAKTWLNGLIENYGSSWGGGVARSELKQMAMIGQTLPGFELITASGKKVTNQDFQGKFLLLDIWASWCPNCARAIPNIAKAYETVDRDKIEFVSINTDLDYAALGKFAKRMNMAWLQLSELSGETLATFSVTAFPCTFLINPEGVIVADHAALATESASKFQARLQKLMTKNQVDSGLTKSP